MGCAKITCPTRLEEAWVWGLHVYDVGCHDRVKEIPLPTWQSRVTGMSIVSFICCDVVIHLTEGSTMKAMGTSSLYLTKDARIPSTSTFVFSHLPSPGTSHSRT
jgi:hypothetical protein